MIGQSAAIREVFECIRQVADTDLTVLIQGESGTGKELVARAIHNLGRRRNGPFIASNVGALPESLIESELFGYEKGAFSGAARRKPGWFEMAQGGTLFLDEVGEMAPKTQVDLLRVLEQQELRRLGGSELIPLDVRLVAATHRDVNELVAEGILREDLYYRLNVVPLRLPPLRERSDDIPPLVEHFLQRACARHGREPKRVAEAAMKILCDYSVAGERAPASQLHRAARGRRRGRRDPCRRSSSGNGRQRPGPATWTSIQRSRRPRRPPSSRP